MDNLENECCCVCGALLFDFESGWCDDCLQDFWFKAEQEKYEVPDYDDLEESGERVKELFYQKLAEKHPESPWLSKNKGI